MIPHLSHLGGIFFSQTASKRDAMMKKRVILNPYWVTMSHKIMMKIVFYNEQTQASSDKIVMSLKAQSVKHMTKLTHKSPPKFRKSNKYKAFTKT